MNTRILQDKTAVVFGAAGSIGAAVAKTFAAEGARVFLAGRTKASLETVAKEIACAGGEVRTAVIAVSIQNQGTELMAERDVTPS